MQTRKHRRQNVLWITIGLSVVLATPRTVAQNNSMFSSGAREPVPNEATRGDDKAAAADADTAANPGAVPQPVVAMHTPPPVIAARKQPVTPPASTKNPLLLRISPISVPAPEPRKIKVNDLITIIVRQSKSALSDSKLKTEKKWDLSAELTKFLRLNPDDHLIPQNFAEGTPGIDLKMDNQYDGKGKADRKDEFTTRISATVLDVKPNGNLVLEAKNRIKMDEEEQIVTLTGTCRTEDITAQNTVLSTQLADLEIVSENTGAVRDASRRGWLMRFFDLARPL